MATPSLLDPNFFRTVLLICEHNDDGAVALILNRPSEELVEDHLPGWAPLVGHPEVVFEGGPVQREVAIGIAGSDADIAIAGWNPVTDRIGLFDLSADTEESSELDRLRIYSGYAGWIAGQLEAEIVTGSWFVFDSTADDPFGEFPEAMWREVIGRQPGSVAMFANFPLDPSQN